MKLLIFDVDGVLEKEEKLVEARMETQMKLISEKYDLSLENAKKKFWDVKNSMSEDRKHTTAYVMEELGISRADYFESLDNINPEGIIEPFENVEEMLKSLSEYRLVVYSNSPVKACKRTLEAINVLKYFDRVYTAEDFNESKPSLKNLKHILNEEGFKVEDTYAVGNSPEKDTYPPMELGIKAILFDPAEKYSEKDGDYIIKDLIEIVEIVKS